MNLIDPHACSNATTAKLLGCSHNTLSRLAGKDILPRAGRGRYDLYDVMPAYIAHKKGEHAKTREERKNKEGLLREQNRKLRLANNKAAASLIETDATWAMFHEVSDVLGEMVAEALVRDADFVLALRNSSSPIELRNMLDCRVAEVMQAIQEALDLDD